MVSARTSEVDFGKLIDLGKTRQAAEWLVRRYADDVMGLCVAMVRDHTASEDLTQDVFSRAFKGLGGFRGEASARTWLLRIARNRCTDHLRALARDPWGGSPVDDGEPDQHPDQAPLPSDLLLRRDDVEDALAQLPEGDRALIVLRFRNGLAYSELAVAFGLKEGTVRMRVSRALVRMRVALEAKHAEPALGAPGSAVFPRAAAALSVAQPSLAAPPAPAPIALGAQERMRAGGAAKRSSLRQFEEARADLVEEAVADFDGDDAFVGDDLFEDSRAEAFEVDASVELPRGEVLHRSARAPGETPLHARRSSAPSRVVGALKQLFRRSPPPLPSPPTDHPLTAFFAATREALTDRLEAQLLEQARSL